jgi:putative DNA primase/helicase
MSVPFIPLHEKARGHWRNILTGLGMPEQHFKCKNGKFLNGPCPLCGGRDRFRLLDKNGDGTWICNQCSNGVQSGVTLALRFTELPYREMAQQVEHLIGHARPEPPPPPKQDPSDWLKRLWRDAEPVRRGDVVDRYLRGRGVGLDVYPRCLRTTRLWHTEARAEFPGMLALVTGPDGCPAGWATAGESRAAEEVRADVGRLAS